MSTPIKVFLFEDMHSFIDGFRMYVDRLENIELVGFASTEEECLAKTKNKPLGIILTDIVIGQNAWGGFTVAEKIISRFRHNGIAPCIIFLSAHSKKEYIDKAIDLHCSYVNKYLPMPDIVDAIEEVYRTKKPVIRIEKSVLDIEDKKRDLALQIRRSLTPSQGKVVVNLYFTWNNTELANKIGISKSTVETHLRNTYQALGLRNEPNCREKLKKMVYESGLVDFIDSINKEPEKWFRKRRSF